MVNYARIAWKEIEYHFDYNPISVVIKVKHPRWPFYAPVDTAKRLWNDGKVEFVEYWQAEKERWGF